MGRIFFFVVLIGGVLFATWYIIQRQREGLVLPAPTGKSVTGVGDILGQPDKYVGESVAVEGTLTKEASPTHAAWFIQDDGGVLPLQLPRGAHVVSSQQEGTKVRAEGTVMRAESGDLVLLLGR